MQLTTSKQAPCWAAENGAATPRQLLTDSKQSPAFSQVTQAGVEIFLQVLEQVGETAELGKGATASSHCSPASTLPLPQTGGRLVSKPSQVALQVLLAGVPAGTFRPSQTSAGLPPAATVVKKPSPQTGVRVLQTAPQLSVFAGSQSSTGASAMPSPQTELQSDGQGTPAMPVSQVSPAAVSTTPLPQSTLLQETVVVRPLVHSPLLAVTVTISPTLAVLQVKVEVSPVTGENVPVDGVATFHV